MSLALEGFRMLDLTRLLPGPVASGMLADFGIDVLKVEEIEDRGGWGRDVFTPPNVDAETEARYAAFNYASRNKQSIAINLKTDEGRQIFFQLAEKSDVVFESYRPGVVQRLGVDYESVRRVNPRLIYCSLSGYGQKGPYAGLPGHDHNYQAVAGVTALTGDEEGNPVVLGFPLVDIGAALHATIGILTALLARAQTGRGQYIDIAMTDVALAWTGVRATRYFRDSRLPRRGLPNLTLLRCKDGKYIATSNSESHFWNNFCDLIGRPQYKEALHFFRDPEAHVSDPFLGEVIQDIQALFLTKTRDEWFQLLRGADVAVAPVLEIDEVYESEYVRQRGFVWALQHPTEGAVRQLGAVVRLSDTPALFRQFAPLRGQHTRKVLKELGYEEARIRHLEESGIVRDISNNSTQH